jgi:hypothetical protein
VAPRELNYERKEAEIMVWAECMSKDRDFRAREGGDPNVFASPPPSDRSSGLSPERKQTPVLKKKELDSIERNFAGRPAPPEQEPSRYS